VEWSGVEWMGWDGSSMSTYLVSPSKVVPFLFSRIVKVVDCNTMLMVVG
jgi:hypothetical protein